MNRLFSNALIGLLFVSMLCSCEKDDVEELPKDVEYVKYGTSFGECVGYCYHSITITEFEVDYEKSSWSDKNAPKINLSNNVDKDNWSDLMVKVDFDKFSQLNSVIGCPDCADGGAEWIEINQNGKTYKVMFEYGNAPETVKAYIGILRNSMNSFE